MLATTSSLLLLPQPPRLVNKDTLRAAYYPAVSSVYSELGDRRSPVSLYVLIALPLSHNTLKAPRSAIFQECQQLLAGLYGLTCQVASEIQMQKSHRTEVASRIILTYDVNSDSSGLPSATRIQYPAGPIVDLKTFALTRRRWEYIFNVDDEPGESMYMNYQKLSNQISPPVEGRRRLVSGGLVSVNQRYQDVEASPTLPAIHHVVAVGGTFDHLHAGHKLLLTAAALLLQPSDRDNPYTCRLIVGITGDQLLKNKQYAEYMRTWEERQRDVVNFLISILLFTRCDTENETEQVSFDETGPNGRAIHTKLKPAGITIQCVEISDSFGPTITDEGVTGLVISGETRSGGKAVNEKRIEKRWKALEVFEVDVLSARASDNVALEETNFASKISSTAIRKSIAEKANNNG